MARRLIPPLSMLILLALSFAALDTARAADASSIDVASIADEHVVESAIDWCIAPRTETRESIAAGACRLEPLIRGVAGYGFRIGFQRESVWLRLRLRNDSEREIERWLQTGLARATQIVVYQQSDGGAWSVSRLGYGVPRAERDFVGHYYDVTRVMLMPRAEREIWVRIVSAPLIDLKTVLWEPDTFRAYKQGVDVWLALTFGGFLLGLAIALLMLFVTKQVQYGFFAMAIVGEMIIETLRTGFMLHFLWPETLPLPIQLTGLGGLLALVGFSGYVFAVVPQIRATRWLYNSIRGLLLVIAIFQIYGLMIDFQIGTLAWGTLVIPVAFLMMYASYIGIRSGSGHARWVLATFFALGIVALTRSPQLTQMIATWWVDVVMSPIAMLIVTSTVLLGLTERTRELERDLATARAAADSQVSFLARMSHELRTPLDTVLGNAQLVMRSERRERMTSEIASILQSGRHLLSMIDEILDYSRGVAGALRLRPEPVLLPEYLQALKTASQALVERNRNRFVMQDTKGAEVPRDLALRLDPGRLRQVLDNLIANAARHTHDGTITLEHGVRALSDGRFRISFAVSDTGEGIAVEDQVRVFQPFERVGREARYGGKGAGMGLAIARQLVSLMGGDLQLQSALGQGSTFRFSLVAEKAPVESLARKARVSAQLPTGHSGSKRLALIIDDDPGSRAIFVAVLESAGFLVREADSGNAALALVDELPRLDVVITDQFMPNGDGWAVLDGIFTRRPDVPCVMISAAPPNPPEGHAPGRRFAATFLKPVDHAALLQTIGEELGLEWILPGAQAPKAVCLPASGVALEPSVLAELRQLVEHSEVTAIRDWARRLRQVSPEHSEFADRVETAALDLDLAALDTLCKRAVSEGADS